jgi:uroporphyrinogen III methyltransferase/synthase
MALNKGTVYLVGAGPGDYRLITLRGLDCISNADVIVYDRLVNPILLNYARPDVEMIYVGKSPDRHTMRQDEINATLVREAKTGKSVVRLKGGDPFVFGRGGEEAGFLLQNGISFEVVPGISSAIAAPAYAGIPVTHRDMASSFAVITGHEAEGKDADSSIKWDKIARACDTLIFLMGMRSLSSIVNSLIENGRDPLERVALIQWGTTPDQQCLIGNLSNIVEKAAQANIASPAIIVVGQVVSLGEKLAWLGKRPLSGKRVMITRPLHQAQKMVDLIADLGGEPWTFPTIKIAPIVKEGTKYPTIPLDQAIADIEEYSWLVFTSINGVTAFFDRMQQLGVDIRSLKDVKICAIGPKTRAELERRGLMVDYVPEEYTSQAMVDGLRSILDEPGTQKILVPRAESAPDVFSVLRDEGFGINEVPAYRTLRGEGNIELIEKLLQEKRIHILTFTSASTVTNFVDMLRADDLQNLLEGVTVACIGPITAGTAQKLGIPVHVVAKEYTVEGMIASILEYINRERGKQ